MGTGWSKIQDFPPAQGGLHIPHIDVPSLCVRARASVHLLPDGHGLPPASAGLRPIRGFTPLPDPRGGGALNPLPKGGGAGGRAHNRAHNPKTAARITARITCPVNWVLFRDRAGDHMCKTNIYAQTNAHCSSNPKPSPLESRRESLWVG